MILVTISGLAVILLGVAFALHRARMGERSRLHLDVLAIALFVPLVAVFFWQPLFLSDVWMPKGGGDLNSYYYPVYKFAAESIRQGTIPLWNPYQYAGSPFAADMEASVFYPPMLLASLLANPFTYKTVEGLLILHYLVAAATMYLYARSLGLGRPAAFGAGTIFAFGGFTVARLGHPNILFATVWFPLTLLFFHHALRHRSISSAILAGAFYGVSILGGHPQMPIYFAFFLALYWVWALTLAFSQGELRGHMAPLARLERRGAVPRKTPWGGTSALSLPKPIWDSSSTMTTSLWSRLLDLAATLRYVLPVPIVGFGVSAVQLLPTVELANLSVRSSITYPQAAEYALEPRGLITMLVPHFFGNDFADYWGLTWSLSEVYGYVGIATLILAGISLVIRPHRSRWPTFYGLVAVFFLLVSMGEKSILHGWMYAFVPMFDKVRSAGRSLLFVDLSLALLAGYGLESLLRVTRGNYAGNGPRLRLVRSIGNRLAVATGGSLVLVTPFFAMAWLATRDDAPKLFQGTLVAVTSYAWSALFLVLGAAIIWFVGRRNRWRYHASLLLLVLIAADLVVSNSVFHPTNQDVTRGFARSEIVDFLLEQGPSYRVDAETGTSDIWQPNLPLVYRFSDVMGLDKPLFYAEYRKFWEGLGSRSTRMYDLLGARYLLARRGVSLDWSKFVPIKLGEGELEVYENRTPLPRAMVIPSAREIPREQMLDELKSGDFDPTKVVLLDTGASAPAQLAQTDSRGEVHALTYPTPNEVLISAATNKPAYLLLSDVMYPGWKAYVDGRETPVLWANFIFRAIQLPEGSHQVRFVFEPWTWKAGLAISAFFWMVVLGTVVAQIRGRRHAI